MDSGATLVPLFRREFELCRVQSGEVVAVLSEPSTRPEYIFASTAAAAALGAEVFEIRVPSGGWDVGTVTRGIVASVPALAKSSPRLDAIREALKRASFVVDLIPDTILHVPLRDELRENGVRILTIVEPPDALERMFPTEELKQEVKALARKLEGIRQMHVTSRGGTDLTYDFGATPVGVQYGYADEPGRWDNWPSALVAHYPIDGSATGTLVLDVGDVICHQKSYASSPVTITVEHGYIAAIEGGLDAMLLTDYLRSWAEPEVYAMSHIGFGMQPNAQWNALAFYEKNETLGMDARCFRGNFLLSTGPNRWTGRLVEAHLDLGLRGCTATLDGQVLLADGVLVTDGALAPA
jgi:2,5-dihydroxypyridine 5,6-dioxygenase